MENIKVAIHIVGFVLIYIFFGVLVYLLPDTMLGPTGTLDIGDFMGLFHEYALIAVGASFACMVTWYVAGEWGVHPNAAKSRWLILWFVLLLVVLGTALVLCFFGPKEGVTTDPINVNVAPYYFIGGFLPFYISSVLFSPTHAKRLIFPARWIRRW